MILYLPQPCHSQQMKFSVIGWHLAHTMSNDEWRYDIVNAFSQTTFLHAFSQMKMYEFRSIFHWSFFLRVKLTKLVQIMAWRRPGDKPFSEFMMVSLLTHTCVIRPQWDDMESSLFWQNTFASEFFLQLLANPTVRKVMEVNILGSGDAKCVSN